VVSTVTTVLEAPPVMARTTIATLASQTSFTLTAGSADNNAYNGCVALVTDSVTAVQKARGVISAYTGSTRIITLLNDPAIFTMAVGDTVVILADCSLKPTVDNRRLDVSSGGEAGLDWANIGSPTTAQNLSGTNIDVDQIVASVSGAVGSVTGLTQTGIADQVWNEVNSDHETVGTTGYHLTNGRNNVLDLVTWVGDAGSNLVSIPWNNAAWDAQVESEVADALADINLDHLCKIAVADTQNMTEVVNNTIIGNILSKSALTTDYDPVTDSLEAIRDNMGTAQTGDSYARLGAPAGASVSADISAIEAQTDDIGALGAGLSAIPWNPAWDAEVANEVDASLITFRLDELLSADSDIDGAAPPAVGSVFHELMTKNTGAFDYNQATDSLEAIRDNVGTNGAALTSTALATAAALATVQADTDDIQSRLPVALIGGRMDSDIEAINNDPTAADDLQLSAATIVQGTTSGVPTTTTIPASNLVSAVDDFYNGRSLIFTSGALADQATAVTDYVGATKTLTVVAVTSAPAAAVTFVLV
jgi:hypothetical protein